MVSPARRHASRSASAPPSASPRRPVLPPAIPILVEEEAVRAAGYAAVAGLDEVGRGSWAGPVVAAAVLLPLRCYEQRTLLAEVTDSKLLTALARERLATAIVECATGAAVGWAPAPVVDRWNVLGATRLAMVAALRVLEQRTDDGGWGEHLARREATVDGDTCAVVTVGQGVEAVRLTPDPIAVDYLLTDALPLPALALPQRALVKGDQRCLCIAAASIVAKVYRDRVMTRLAVRYPEFEFERNKGYGTRTHLRALRAHGLTPLHRRTFAPAKYLLALRDHVRGLLPGPPDSVIPLLAASSRARRRRLL